MNQLVLRYEYDGNEPIMDDFGRLTMSVTTDQFSGSGRYWVQWQDLVEFGNSLATFPIPPDAALEARWGLLDCLGDNLALAVSIAPANSTGDLRVTAEIGRCSNLSGDQLRTSFLTNYPDIERFRLSLARLMDRKAEQALLKGQ